MAGVSTVKPAVPLKTPNGFDLQKFETMVEPFTIRIDKIKGSMKYEIPLPVPDDGSAPGTGWNKQQVREVQTWLVTEWAGGGHYAFSIADSTSPTPVMMTWNAYYPVQDFPEKIPPTLQGAWSQVPPNAPTVTQKGNMVSFPGSGSSLPPASAYGAMSTLVPQTLTPQAQSFFPPVVPYGYTSVAPANHAAQNEVQILRDQVARAREEAAAREFEKRLGEIKSDNDRRFAEMQRSQQDMIEKLAQAMKDQTAARALPLVDPGTEALKETVRRLEEQNRRQQEDMERARRESELRDQMRASQEATAKLVEESNRRFEAFMQANANKGPDPQMMMFQQMFSAQMEAMKEIARQSQTQLDRVQSMIMRPQDVLAIAKDSATSTDQVATTMNRQWEAMFNVQRQVIEQVAQLNQGQGGNEVVGLVRDGAAALAEMAKKYTGDKAKTEVAAMNAQAEVAKANAAVQTAQLHRMTEMARAEHDAKAAAAASVAGLAGVATQMPNGTFRAPAASQGRIAAPVNNGRPWVPPKTPRTDATNAAAAAANGEAPPSNVVQLKAVSDEPPRLNRGRTDIDWFGPILPNVNQLRHEVASFITGLEQVPPVKQGCDPIECATTVQVAASEIMQRQIPISAMIDLLIPGRVADFLDVLLPDAPQSYRDDVVKILLQQDDGEVPDGDADDDDDADDAESEGAATVS